MESCGNVQPESRIKESTDSARFKVLNLKDTVFNFKCMKSVWWNVFEIVLIVYDISDRITVRDGIIIKWNATSILITCRVL